MNSRKLTLIDIKLPIIWNWDKSLSNIWWIKNQIYVVKHIDRFFDNMPWNKDVRIIWKNVNDEVHRDKGIFSYNGYIRFWNYRIDV